MFNERKKTASREINLHQPSFLNPTDEIQRYPSYSALQPTPSGRAAFATSHFHDRVHTNRNKLNPVIIGSRTLPDIQIRNTDLYQERHLHRRISRLRLIHHLAIRIEHLVSMLFSGLNVIAYQFQIIICHLFRRHRHLLSNPPFHSFRKASHKMI